MDGLDLLIQDHQSVRERLAAADAPGQPDPALVNRLISDVSVHDAIERAHLYPLISVRLDGGKRRVDQSIEEHGEAGRLLAELDRRNDDDPHRRPLIDSLAEALIRHMDEEEREVFPALRARVAPEELEELGDRLASAREKAPTRPHPHSAGSGMGARMGAGLLGPLDRTRDRVRGRQVDRSPPARPAERSSTDVFTAVGRQHREIEHLLGRLLGDPGAPELDDAARREFVNRLVALSARHEAAEELVLWPTVRRRVKGGDALADEALQQERDGRYRLDTLGAAHLDSRWLGLVQETAEGIWAHIAFEEQKVWPELRPTLGRFRGRLLGGAFLRANRVTPTRPHPRGPDRPLGLSTAGLAGSTLDRLRDRFSGRG